MHWFAVGSTGEVHDHVCHWKDDKTLTCDPLRATMEGAPITETVTIVFDGGKMTWDATTTTKDGDVKYTATAKKTS